MASKNIASMQLLADYINDNALFIVGHISTWNALAVYYYILNLRKDKRSGMGWVRFCMRFLGLLVLLVFPPYKERDLTLALLISRRPDY